MTRLLSFILGCIYFFIPHTFAAESIQIQARVLGSNAIPKITILSPDYLNNALETEYMEKGSSLILNFEVTDSDDNNLSFTLSPSEGAVSLESGGPVVSGYSNRFVYLSPNTPLSSTPTITITLTDGKNAVSKTINLYLY
ncbi:hypothetical protein COB57_00385 [Candidatus Peregrinibacteria bacterium]|nr:MAG: hypothetical protein COB57_00385 [Candidatus Peregrinibacteria bacterium]